MPRYEQDSIVEALCEFAFEPSSPWDPTVFGRFLQELGESDYPHREAGEVVEVGLMTGNGGVFPSAQQQQRMRFFNSDRTKLAQVGPDLVTANVLKPYPHWSDFQPFIMKALRAYRSAGRPKSLARLALRYIDRIELPESASSLGSWLEAGSSDFVPGFLRDAGPGAFSRVSKQTGSSIESITVALDSSPVLALIMDTELVLLFPPEGEDELVAVLDSLHERINEIFEGSITQHTRDVLRPVPR
jgi:uncharacterized protein (TIGR04255 family)